MIKDRYILQPRKDAPNGHYTYETDNMKFSVIDFSTTLFSQPKPEGVFLGWEAVPYDKGVLNYDMIKRDMSWAKLQKILDSIMRIYG